MDESGTVKWERLGKAKIIEGCITDITAQHYKNLRLAFRRAVLPLLENLQNNLSKVLDKIEPHKYNYKCQVPDDMLGA